MRFVIFLIPALAIAAEYSTYIGDAYPRTVAALATDATGNTYIAGNRAGTALPIGYPMAGPIQVAASAGAAPNDVFVTKLDPTGKIVFTNTFAGKGQDQGLAVAVDPAGSIYVAGTTTSSDFPITNALQPQTGSSGAGFIVKLSGDGKTIVYSTYFGGLAGPTTVSAMTTDPSGNLYLTGTTSAADFPVTSGMPGSQPASGPAEGQVAFVTAISAAGDKILFSGTIGAFGTFYCPATFFGCSNITQGVAIGLDAALNVYVGGNTVIALATTPEALVPTGLGAFVAKIAANGNGLAYLTYLGAASELGPGYMVGSNVLSSLTADRFGNVYVAGTTGDPKFPVTPGAYQTTFSGTPIGNFGYPANTDGFVAKINPAGSAFLWATYIGGNGNDAVNSITVDAAGDVWCAGTTASTNFPNAQGWSQGGDFLVEFNPPGSALTSSAQYPSRTISQAAALDPAMFIHAAGATGIVSDLITTAHPSPRIFGAGNIAGGSLAGRVSPAEVISIYGSHIGPATAVTATPVAGFYPTEAGGVQVTIGGIAAPLLYASEGQINAVVPMAVTASAASTIQIVNGAVTTPEFPLWIDTSDPVMFLSLLNSDGSLNSQANPAKLGSAVSFYATGWQSSFPGLSDGQVATQANDICSGCSIPSGLATFLYAGAAPGIVAGVTQFNLFLNDPYPPGAGPTLGEVIPFSFLNTYLWVWFTP